MEIGDILAALERFAPLSFQEDYDNAGLQLGLTKVEATGVLLCLDITEDVIDEAVACGCNLVVSHHPLVFRPIKSITGRNYVERCIIKAIKNDIAIYSAHTNLDNILNGVNSEIACRLGLSNLRILRPVTDALMKLVSFVPSAHLESVRNALFDAGCGKIGNYDSCSYSSSGEGTFRALEGANPFVGNINSLHHEKEEKLEVVFHSYMKNRVIQVLLDAHPYETPAYDIVELYSTTSEIGGGMIGELPEPVPAADFMKRIKNEFKVERLAYSGNTDRMISRVAICGGAGSFLIGDAVRQKADLFMTGEIKYHEMCGFENEIVLVETGHYESEQFTQNLIENFLKKQFPELKTMITNIGTNLKKYL